MKIEEFLSAIGDPAFFTGVPDSQLKPLCNYLMATYGIGDRHIIAANEGNATALAAGYHFATGKIPLVYMQNSGIGNVINPVCSLMNDKVYAVPCIFVVGWRGEPGIHDEPQHIYQGEVTVPLLEQMDVATFVVSAETAPAEIEAIMRDDFSLRLAAGKDVAFVIRKGALTYDGKVTYRNENTMRREEIIRHVASAAGEGVIVSTTGKASRELFEIREQNGEGHGHDFLTVGSMGHSSSVALGVALNKPNTAVYCIDGDGAALMHLGALAVIGSRRPRNLIHIVINNAAHETVGGMPTAAATAELTAIAAACGYGFVKKVTDFDSLDRALAEAKERGDLSFIEVPAAIGAREDLGRPTTTARQNKENFMAYLKERN